MRHFLPQQLCLSRRVPRPKKDVYVLGAERSSSIRVTFIQVPLTVLGNYPDRFAYIGRLGLDCNIDIANSSDGRHDSPRLGP